MNEDLRNLMNAVGALSELAKMHYDSLMAVGFNDQQALYLVGKILGAAMRMNGGKDDYDC